MMDGRPYFVAGYTSGGVPYGIFEDEMHDLDDLRAFAFSHAETDGC
jgi:hypothetical protein